MHLPLSTCAVHVDSSFFSQSARLAGSFRLVSALESWRVPLIAPSICPLIYLAPLERSGGLNRPLRLASAPTILKWCVRSVNALVPKTFREFRISPMIAGYSCFATPLVQLVWSPPR